MLINCTFSCICSTRLIYVVRNHLGGFEKIYNGGGKRIFLLGDPFNGFACFRTHLFAFGGPGGVDSAFSANCSLGLLWLRDSFFSLII